MKLSDLVRKIEYLEISHGEDFEIRGVSNNSQKIEKDYIFVAVKGSIFDGHRYIDEAIEKGAKAIIHTEEVAYKQGITYLRVGDSREVLAEISNYITDFPSEKLSLIGVTGTNGKTTTSKLIAYLIGKIFGPCANIGTDGADVGGEIIETSNTTPDITEINSILKKCLEKQIKYVTLEASSHGLDQKRLAGVHFKVGILNNLSTEHLDYHKTMEEYFKAKMILFENSEITIANTDDPWGEKAVSLYENTLTFGTNKNANVRATDVEKTSEGISFKIDGVDFFIKTIADFELNNYLAAISTLKVLGASLSQLSDVISEFPGVGSRFEYIENDKDLNIIVDFAHTPRAFEAIFESIPKDVKTYAVFGINGDRNTEFRRLIGNACAKNNVFAVITTDDPKFDNYDHITDEIAAGIDELGGDYERIEDRLEAMTFAIKKANPGDYILMLGKGEEHFMKYHGNEKTPYNEMETVQKAIKNQ